MSEWLNDTSCIIIIIRMNVLVNLNSVKVINKPCMSSRRMHLLPRAALRSDSEQLDICIMITNDAKLHTVKNSAVQ
jgi:hypothetical protein